MEEEKVIVVYFSQVLLYSLFLDDFKTNTNKCLILIHGSGPVRAGIWARYCCINDSLNIGSMIPFVQEGKKKGYATIILNPNLNYSEVTRVIY